MSDYGPYNPLPEIRCIISFDLRCAASDMPALTEEASVDTRSDMAQPGPADDCVLRVRSGSSRSIRTYPGAIRLAAIQVKGWVAPSGVVWTSLRVAIRVKLRPRRSASSAPL